MQHVYTSLCAVHARCLHLVRLAVCSSCACIRGSLHGISLCVQPPLAAHSTTLKDMKLDKEVSAAMHGAPEVPPAEEGGYEQVVDLQQRHIERCASYWGSS